jgi:Flp pilus assembly pilin Flp
MFKIFKNRKAQSTAEYAILIGIVVAVAVAMQTYVKRGLQGRLKDASDEFITTLNGADWTNVSTVAATALNQYEPTELTSQSTQQVLTDVERVQMEAGGIVTRTVNLETTQNVGDYQRYGYNNQIRE